MQYSIWGQIEINPAQLDFETEVRVEKIWHRFVETGYRQKQRTPNPHVSAPGMTQVWRVSQISDSALLGMVIHQAVGIQLFHLERTRHEEMRLQRRSHGGDPTFANFVVCVAKNNGTPLGFRSSDVERMRLASPV